MSHRSSRLVVAREPQKWVPVDIFMYNAAAAWFLNSIMINSLGFILLSLDLTESVGIRTTGALLNLFGVLLQAWNCVALGLDIKYLKDQRQPIMRMIIMELFEIVFFGLTIAIVVQTFNFI